MASVAATRLQVALDRDLHRSFPLILNALGA
jgi:hypothetical protein